MMVKKKVVPITGIDVQDDSYLAQFPLKKSKQYALQEKHIYPVSFGKE